MPERAGYTLVVYAIDVSPSMADAMPDPATGQKRAKLDLAKEFVARKCEPKVSRATR
jgi:ATP-dependent DNA helicase 2 subunit 2